MIIVAVVLEWQCRFLHRGNVVDVDVIIVRLGRGEGGGGVYLADENPLAEDGDGFFDGAEGAGRVHGGVEVMLWGFHGVFFLVCAVCEFLLEMKKDRESGVINVI